MEKYQSFVGALTAFVKEMKTPPPLEHLFCGHCGSKLKQESYCQTCGKIFEEVKNGSTNLQRKN